MYFSCKEIFEFNILLLLLCRNNLNAIFFYYHSVGKENYTRRCHLKGCRQKHSIHNSSIYCKYVRFISFGTILNTIFALSSIVTTGREGIFQRCIYYSIFICYSKWEMYMFRQSKEITKHVKTFLICKRNFLIKICICAMQY